MATKKSGGDQYANIAAVFCTEAVAGTAKYERFAFPYSVTDKVALLISRIEYWWGQLSNLDGTMDYCIAGLTVSDKVVDLTNQADPTVVDNNRIIRVDMGTAASGLLYYQPAVKDFSQLPGGGVLIAPAPLYGVVQSSGAAGAMNCWIKMFYTYKELAVNEYWELVESRRIISS